MNICNGIYIKNPVIYKSISLKMSLFREINACFGESDVT
jgi:hypothetical protein